MSKKLIKNVALSGVLGVLAFGALLHNNILHLPFQREVHTQYIADLSNDRILMGASHNVFVGKVIKQVGTKDTGAGPETQFEVEVVDNIKGKLQGNVVVEQFGGYKNGVLYLVHGGDTMVPETTQGDGLLVPGSTYLFATRYNKKENWYTISAPPFDKKLLSESKKLSNSELKVLARNDARVRQLQEAYKNEILLDLDIKSGNTLNSYTSLQTTQKTK